MCMRIYYTCLFTVNTILSRKFGSQIGARMKQVARGSENASCIVGKRPSDGSAELGKGREDYAGTVES